jgi:hypothetical protein
MPAHHAAHVLHHRPFSLFRRPLHRHRCAFFGCGEPPVFDDGDQRAAAVKEKHDADECYDDAFLGSVRLSAAIAP